ncbi:ethanolamine utilization protein [Clostridium aminobutyricum]|uniref:Ethanolamine utilization protein n=1 Tax=Clostridium aminobutyricum TaxID=33953 RepID=A0A939II47_CLOAM|nr:ethanolamine utilization protein [Clostridium aminobutyricum]MBN7774552.1 ethanolamine utilization protein [Clostridium aminobutyricum]
MKFITEEDLRDLYKKEPFTTYEIEPGARLTPGARQFLADRGIHMFDDDPCVVKKPVATAITAKPTAAPVEKKSDWRKKKLHCKLKSMEALFLLTGEDLISRDVLLAQNVIQLGKQFSSIKHTAEGKALAEYGCCKQCTGMNAENFCKDIDDCFDITEFHLHLEKSKEILRLHQLRCALREVEPVVMEVYEGSESENVLCEEIIGQVNQIINCLSQMICAAIGGKECQRTN